jgi:hypothetical protein
LSSLEELTTHTVNEQLNLLVWNNDTGKIGTIAAAKIGNQRRSSLLQ